MPDTRARRSPVRGRRANPAAEAGGPSHQPFAGRGLVPPASRNRPGGNRAAAGDCRPAAHRHHQAAPAAVARPALPLDGVLGVAVSGAFPERDSGKTRGAHRGGQRHRQLHGAGHAQAAGDPPDGDGRSRRGSDADGALLPVGLRRLRQYPGLCRLARPAGSNPGLQVSAPHAAIPAVAEASARNHRAALAAQDPAPLAAHGHPAARIPRRAGDPDPPRPGAEHPVHRQLH